MARSRNSNTDAPVTSTTLTRGYSFTGGRPAGPRTASTTSAVASNACWYTESSTGFVAGQGWMLPMATDSRSALRGGAARSASASFIELASAGRSSHLAAAFEGFAERGAVGVFDVGAHR